MPSSLHLKPSSADVLLFLKQFFRDELAQVDGMMANLGDDGWTQLISSVVKHVAGAGGKRLRPILALACGKLIDCNPRISIILAAVVEFIHTATLLHDDVIDETAFRRGVSTANNVWGNKACILVGDYQFSQAFKLMLQTECIAVLELLADASAKMAEAEIWQLELIGCLDGSLPTYMRLIEAKTATLFMAACKSGAVFNYQNNIGNITLAQIEALEGYGRHLGVIFQIVDDLLDYYAADDRFGKKIGNDLRERKITLPVILAYNEANSTEQQKLQQIFAAPAADEKIETQQFDYVLKILNKYQVNSQTHEVLQKHIAHGGEMLDILPCGAMHGYLQELLTYAPARLY